MAKKRKNRKNFGKRRGGVTPPKGKPSAVPSATDVVGDISSKTQSIDTNSLDIVKYITENEAKVTKTINNLSGLISGIPDSVLETINSLSQLGAVDLSPVEKLFKTLSKGLSDIKAPKDFGMGRDTRKKMMKSVKDLVKFASSVSSELGKVNDSMVEHNANSVENIAKIIKGLREATETANKWDKKDRIKKRQVKRIKKASSTLTSLVNEISLLGVDNNPVMDSEDDVLARKMAILMGEKITPVKTKYSMVLEGVDTVTKIFGSLIGLVKMVNKSRFYILQTKRMAVSNSIWTITSLVNEIATLGLSDEVMYPDERDKPRGEGGETPVRMKYQTYQTALKDITKIFDSYVGLIKTINKNKFRISRRKARAIVHSVDTVNYIVEELSNLGKPSKRKQRRMAKSNVAAMGSMPITGGAAEIVSTSSEPAKPANLKNTELLLKSYAGVLKALLILAPLGAAVMIMAPVIIVVTWAVFKVVGIINRIASKRKSAEAVASMSRLTIVVGSILLLGLAILGMSLLAAIMPVAIGGIIKLILSIGMVVLVIAAFALMVEMMSPILGFVKIAALSLLVAVGAILLIAAALWVIGEIKLDHKKIRRNVKKIIGLVLDIIMGLFDPEATHIISENASDEDKGLAAVLGIVAVPVAAIMGAATLVAAMIGTIAMLLIALCLKGIELIHLDKKKIDRNVDTILGTVLDIIKRLSERPKMEEYGNKGIVECIIGFVMPSLGNMIGAILAMATLAAMVVAVLAISLMALMLRGIQELNLDKEKIQQNINDVLDTCNMIVQAIFSPDQTDNDPSNRGILGSLIGWVMPSLTPLITAIFTMAYLAVMVISVVCILGIAGMLKLISLIDPETMVKAREVVAEIMDTLDYIRSCIFKRDSEETEMSNHGALMYIIKWVAGPGVSGLLEGILLVANLAMMFFAVFIIAGIAKAMQTISGVDMETVSQARENARVILAGAQGMVDDVINAKYEKPKNEDQGWFKSMLDFIVPPGLRAITSAMSAIAKLSIIKIAIGSVAQMAQDMMTVSKVSFDEKTVAASFLSTINVAKKVLAQIIDDGDLAEKGIKKKLERGSENLKLLSESLSEVKKMTGVLMSLTSTSLQALDASGQVVGKTLGITIGLASTIASKNVPPASMWDRIIGSAEGLSEFTRAFLDSNVKEDDVHRTASAYRMVVAEFSGILAEQQKAPMIDLARAGANLSLIERISDIVGGFTHISEQDVDNSRKVTDNYIRFMQEVDKMDYNKLNVSAWMMRYWASISRDLRGDFEGLSKTINQYIMPMLDNLNKTMDEATKCQHSIIEELTKPVDFSMGGGGMPGSMPDTGSGSSTGGSSSGLDGFTPGSATGGGSSPTDFSQKSGSSMGSLPPLRTSMPMDAGDIKTTKKYTVQFAKIEEQ